MENSPKKQETLSDFAIFILSHENPDCVFTARSLKKYGYTGNWYIVLDTDDKTYDKYVENFGKDRIVLFDKKEVAKTVDRMDNGKGYTSVVFARNACFQIARELDYTYFMECDDDYYEFEFRYEDEGHLRVLYPTKLDLVMECLLDYYKSIPQMKTLCIAQNGDFLGGVQSSHWRAKFMRKAMNTFICSVDREFKFMGWLNEDVNTYCLEGSRGELFATIMDFSIAQIDTQTRDRGFKADGLAKTYTGSGTYRKSFYTILCCPSFVKIGIIGNNHARIHHNVQWENAVPKIISDKYKKSKEERV